MPNLYLSGAVVAITILVNLVLAYSGQTQKLTCTIEQTANVAAAVLGTPTQK